MDLFRHLFVFGSFFICTSAFANSSSHSCVLLEKVSTFSTGSESSGTFTSSALLKDGTLAAGTVDGHLYLLAKDGSKLAETSLGSAIFAAPLEMKDGRLAVGTEDGTLHVIRRADLKPDFVIFTRDGIFGTPIQMDDGTLVFGSYDQNLYFVTADGKGELHFATHGAIIAPPVRVNASLVAVTSTDRWVYWIDQAGQAQASFMTNGKLFSKPVALQDGTLVVASSDGFLYWLGLDGKVKSKFDAQSPIVADLALAQTPRGEVVIAAASNGVLIFLNSAGHKIGSFSSNSTQLSAPTVVSVDTFAVGTGEGNIELVGLDGKLKGVFQVTGTPVDGLKTTSVGHHEGLAPADEYFGQGKMSVLGIHSALIAFSIDLSGNLANATKDLEAIRLTEDAIQDWELKYPQDNWLPREYFGLARVYEKSDSLETELRALRSYSWLEGHYSDSWYALTAHSKLVSEKVDRGVRSFPLSMGSSWIAVPAQDHSVYFLKTTAQAVSCE